MADATAEVREIADDAWRQRLRLDPLLCAREGLPVTTLRGLGFADVEEHSRLASILLTRLEAVDTSAVSHDDALTIGYLRHVSAQSAEAPRFYWQSFLVAPQAFGLQYTALIRQVFAAFAFEDSGDVERYLGLLRDLTGMIDDLGDQVHGQCERGIRLPRPALPVVRAMLAGFAASSADLIPDGDRLAAVGPTATSAGDRAEALVRGELAKAFARLSDLLGPDYESLAPVGVGIGQFPGGEEAYRFAIRRFVGLDIEPEQIHAIGLDEVAALAEKMAEIRATLGFSGSEADFHRHLRQEPRLFAASPKEVEERYRGYVARLEPLLPTLFRVRPQAPYDVERLSPELEASVTYGYYEPPIPTRPVGLYRYNASELDRRWLLSAQAIAYHELAPGHHFHIARQIENEALPDIRRQAFDIGAFNEGWAEYAAGLGWEAGLYDNPFDAYGRLSHERFIAQRLVIDTGMNVLGWSLERARAYMSEHTVESTPQVESETLRYSTFNPGQALGYRLGHLRILQARNRVSESLGDAFDVRDFHEAILGAGALPLPVLDEHLDWFAAQQG